MMNSVIRPSQPRLRLRLAAVVFTYINIIYIITLS